MRKTRFLVWLLAGGFLASAQAQPDFSKAEIKIAHVAGNIHMLTGMGGNIGISVGDDGVLIVDSQFAPLSPKIEAAIEKLGKGKPKFLLNTHWHPDHTGGNPSFGKYADIIAQTNVRKRLAASPNANRTGLPVITFDETLSVHFNGEEIRMIHLQPGHTDGDSIVMFTGSKVVHTGDAYINGQFPYFDLASGGDAAGYVKNIDRLLGEIAPGTKIIPGHGALATLDNMRETKSMLAEVVGGVQKDIAAGKTMDQIKAAGVPAQYKSWGAGFINPGRFLELTFNSLTKK